MREELLCLSYPCTWSVWGLRGNLAIDFARLIIFACLSRALASRVQFSDWGWYSCLCFLDCLLVEIPLGNWENHLIFISSWSQLGLLALWGTDVSRWSSFSQMLFSSAGYFSLSSINCPLYTNCTSSNNSTWIGLDSIQPRYSRISSPPKASSIEHNRTWFYCICAHGSCLFLSISLYVHKTWFWNIITHMYSTTFSQNVSGKCNWKIRQTSVNYNHNRSSICIANSSGLHEVLIT